MREPCYMESYEKGLLVQKAEQARALLGPCILCPRQCRKDRLNGETGVCRTEQRAVVSSFHPHFGEEEPLVGRGGSGTVFFTHCNLMCLYHPCGRAREIPGLDHGLAGDEYERALSAARQEGIRRLDSRKKVFFFLG